MRVMLKSLPLIACAVALAGCSNPFGKQGYLRDKSGDYTKAETAGPAKVPEGMNAKSLGSVLVIPPIENEHVKLSEDYEVPRPAQRLTRGDGETYSIERDGDRSWLLAARNPSEIWPRVEAFVGEAELPVTRADAKKGVLETGWINLGKDSEHGLVLRTVGKWVGVKDLDPIEDRFRIEVIRGTREGTSEIHIQHKGRPPSGSGKAPEPAVWNNLGDRSLRVIQALSADMLVFLAKSDEGSVSYLAQELDIKGNTELSQDGNGNPLLAIRGLSYAQSWAAIGDALSKAGIPVSDRNRSAGIYYLPLDPKKITAPEKEKGFFSRLFGSDKKEPEAKGENLHLRVSQFPDMVQVSVEKDSSTSAGKEESQKLLELIRKNLK
ncbi:outer membrane protein assembly factor BamC [Endozoicomonas sp. Mp262]|uniref:outer membrane protein assembly factor BamC n=1 Tax=Endozoicomonas sp. Mp262 TaxID=2919499 RepID=UPI0021DAB76B